MKFSIKLLDSDKEISNSILDALLPQIDIFLKKNLKYIRKEMPLLINNIIKNSETYNSLIGGQLKYEFGIPDADSKLSTILNIWSNNISIEYTAPKILAGQIKASFSVSIIRSDFSDVLASDSALVIDNLRGYNLPWLEWLLLEGNTTIVPKQEVIIGPSKFSRTGFALMRESNKPWKVPAQYSGTIRDNWITRAIDDNESLINELLERAFKI